MPVRVWVTLVLITMGWAQLFGLKRTYVAQIDGRWIETQASHHHACDTLQDGHIVCFVPHEHHDESSISMDHELAFAGVVDHCDAEHQDCGSAPVNSHIPMQDPLQLLKAPTVALSFQAPLVAILEVWELQYILGLSPLSSCHQARLWFERQDPELILSHAPEVARCMVMLI